MVMGFFELNWIAKKHKNIPKPLLCFENIDTGGCYYSPDKEEVLINNSYYSLDKGLIVVNHTEPEEITNTIAHEWRHHQQFINGIEFMIIDWESLKGEYEKKIELYFKKSQTEMDALLFSNIYAPSETSIQWQEWIFKNSNKFINYARNLKIRY